MSQTSPLPVSRTATAPTPTEGGMSFPDALRHVIKGSRITKKEWKDSGRGSEYLELKSENFILHKANGEETNIILRAGDLLGTDWVVLEA